MISSLLLHEVDLLLRRRDGVAHIQDLLAIGVSRNQVAHLHRRGDLLRPRIGWYCDPRLDGSAVRAIRVGGVLGCVDAAASWGLAVPERRGDRLHVSLAVNASRLRRSADGAPAGIEGVADVQRHWEERVSPVRGFRVAPVDAILQMAACTTEPWLLAALDSGLRPGHPGPRAQDATAIPAPLLDGHDLGRIREHLPAALAGVVDLADGIAESPPESLARYRFHHARIPFRAQVRIGRRRVDFLIDEWIVVEIDGSSVHSGPAAFADDRRRDAELALLGYRVLRFTYRQIVDDFDGVLAVLRAVRAERPVAR